MKRIGRYEILEEIGRGGFGLVYRASDPTMKRVVAIKVMASTNDPELLGRFRNEAASAGHLRHESIVTVYDFGEENGVPFIVMEYLEGMDLQKIHDRKVPLSLLEKVRILCQAASGLEAAHASGIIHRDVKPANIMILKDGSVKIMDFGIARLNVGNATHYTRTGMVMGTLQYVSPEQYEGQPADALTDIWGFGVIAFQLLSGRNPFEGGDTPYVLYRITTQKIPDVREISPGLPEDLALVVAKLLRRDRPARFQSFEDVRFELKAIEERLETLDAARVLENARALAARGDLNGAHQLVRQILERQPSNAEARQLRDRIVSQLRAAGLKQQVEELIRQGDLHLEESRAEEAADFFAQACRMNPNSATARLRLERATGMAERARRTRAELNQARARLAAGSPREARRIVAVVLAGDPANVEGASLLAEIGIAVEKQDEASRADAILRARVLASNDQYTEAVALLLACAAQSGDHAELQKAGEEIRRAAAEWTERNKIEELISQANECIRRRAYAQALAILAPLARVYPGHAGIRETIARANGELARQAAMELSAHARATPAPGPAIDLPADCNATAIIQRHDAGEVRQNIPETGEPDSSLTVALPVGYQRPVAPTAPPPARTVAPAALPPPRTVAPAALPPARTLAPAAPAPAPPTAFEGETLSAPYPGKSSSRVRAGSWAAAAAAVCLVAGGLYYRQTRAPKTPAALVAPRTHSEPLPATDEKPSGKLATPPPPEPEVITKPEVVTKEDLKARDEITKEPEVKAKADKTVPRPAAQRIVDEEILVKRPRDPKPGTKLVPDTAAPAQTSPPPLPDTPIAPIPWHGLRRGQAIWTGLLAPGARLILGSNGVQEGGGQLSVPGESLPTVDIAVSGMVPELVYQVFPATRAQRIVITNNGPTPVESLRFNWALK